MNNVRRRRRAGAMIAAGALCAAGLMPAFQVSVQAVTMRDDQPESLYISLAADPAYASSGAVFFPGMAASGILITPKWVITAGHVTQGASSGSFNIGGTTWTNGTTYTESTANSVSWHFSNPGWAGTLSSGTDIGLMRLSAPVTGVTPASRYFGSSELGNVGVSVGFGLTGTGYTGYQSNTAGTKLAFQNTLDVFGPQIQSNYSSNIMAADFDNPNNPSDSVFGSSAALTLEGCVAPGDSGGGTYINVNGRWVAAGVHSFLAAFQPSGTPAGDGIADASYSDIFGDTRISQFSQWIDDSIVNYWNPASSGTFSTATNWVLGPSAQNLTPGDGDIVGFRTAGTYTVTLDGNTLTHQILARGGNVTLNLNGFTYNLSSTMYEGGVVVARYAGETAAITFTNGVVNSHDANISEQYGSSGQISVNAGATWNVTGDVYVSGTYDGPGGNATLSLLSSTAAMNVSGTLRVTSNGKLLYNAGSLSVGTLDLEGGNATLSAGTPKKVLRTQALTINAAKLDLNNNDMIVNYTGSSPIATIKSYIQSGYDNGAQDGSGIISTRAKTSPNSGEAGATRLGYGEAGALGITSFDGVSVDSTTVLVKYTYAGDANLDGKVDVRDLLALAMHWNTSGDGWTQGDFNYDGVVNAADLTYLARNWQAGVSAPLGEPVSLAAALASLNLSFASVPEPASIALFGLGILGIASRRRRPRRVCPN